MSAFEGLSKQLAADLGATGESCFREELKDSQGAQLSDAWGGDGYGWLWGPEALAALQTVIAAAGSQAGAEGPKVMRTRATHLRCARAASWVRPAENQIPMEVPLDCLAHSQLKATFYGDLARHFAELPWSTLRHPFLPYYDRSIFVDFAPRQTRGAQARSG
eukprot:Skav230146  [mRNA]  locus=scaffold1301:222729:227988:- [translate_table: standard]